MSAFGCWLGLGAAVGLLQAWREAPPAQRGAVLEAAPWAALGLALGARAAYVWAHAGAFWARPWVALALWEGGAAWPGAVLGYALGLLWAARRLRRPWSVLSDALLPFAAGMAFGAWWGCVVDGCFYGPPWPYGPAWPDEWGVRLPRWPLQAVGLLGSGAIFAWAQHLRRHGPPGRATAAASLAAGVWLACLTTLRADPHPFWGPLPVETWAALAWAAWGALAWWWTRRPRRVVS